MSGNDEPSNSALLGQRTSLKDGKQKVIVTDGKINGFRVNMLVTFVLGGDTSI
jgi:hypothetical protein